MRIIKNLEAIFLELTAAASWLNTAFAGYDRLILSALHAVSNSFFTFLAKLITLIGEKGLVFFLVAIIFMLFPKTRKLGVCIFGAVCCGALITNVILKDAIARPRPLTVAPYSQWWADINAPAEDGWSFPSGHVTAAAAGLVAIRLMKGKKVDGSCGCLGSADDDFAQLSHGTLSHRRAGCCNHRHSLRFYFLLYYPIHLPVPLHQQEKKLVRPRAQLVCTGL